MKITEKQKLVIAIVIFAISGFVIYKTFFGSQGTQSATIDGSSMPQPGGLSPDEQVGQDILNLADKLDSTTIDSKIFDSAVFKSLVDFDLPISPEPIGRPNPFSLIGIDIGNVNTTNFILSSSSNSQIKTTQ